MPEATVNPVVGDRTSCIRSAALCLVVLVVVATLALVETSYAQDGAGCFCGQPVSGILDVASDGPVATDCLFILNVAIGLQSCDPTCICDLDASGATPTSTDALLCLNAAVGVPDLLECDCAEPCVAQPPCSEMELTLRASSTLDIGWTGDGHDASLPVGGAMSIVVLRRCGGGGAVCEVDADCSGETCDPTCDCSNGGDTACEITGPVSEKRCSALTNVSCDEDDDCSPAQTCSKPFGPPLPLSVAGTPLCVTTHFVEDLAGVIDTAAGTLDVSVFVNSRSSLGTTLDQPCPRCGALSETPAIGDTFTCEGGPLNGEPCTVDGMSVIFGGTSLDCPPEPMFATGVTFSLRIETGTTGTVSMDAVIPCGGSLEVLHPSNGGAVCLDSFAACSTNADCRRCTGSPTEPCTSNGDCSGNGTCAAAPEQPVACGIYCHCGFCDEDPYRPCNADADCAVGETCAQGSGAAQQLQGNDCNNLTCGLGGDEQCCSSDTLDCETPTAKVGKCTLAPYRGCSTNADCSPQNAGACALSNRPCFENRIERTGAPSPLGSYCIDDSVVVSCTTNADCAVGACVSDTAKPATVALSCLWATSSASINAAAGLAGPVAVSFDTIVRVYRCGNALQEGAEECDDGNRVNGDGCDEICRVEP